MVYYTEHTPGRTVQCNGREYLYFGGTSYLGLQSNLHFKNLWIKNCQRFGSNYGSSRLSNIRLTIYHEAEDFLATWAGSQKALVVSSGFLAGQLLRSFFSTGSYHTFCSPNTHAALLGNFQSRSRSNNDLIRAVKQQLAKTPSKPVVVFMDSMDFSGSGYPSYSLLKELPMEDLIVVADDSHGLGIVGDNGGGVFKKLMEFSPGELLVCASMSKALGLQGGVIFGTEKRLSEIWDTPFFAGASPPPPAHMATLLASEAIYKRQRQRLMENVGQFQQEWNKTPGMYSIEGYPVIGFKNAELTKALADKNILVTDFRYTSYQDDPIPGRIVLNSLHQPPDIRQLTAVLNTFPENNAIDDPSI